MRQTFYLGTTRPNMEVATPGVDSRTEGKIYIKQLKRTHPLLANVVMWANNKTIGFRFQPDPSLTNLIYRIVRGRTHWDQHAKQELEQLKSIDI